MLLSRRCEDPSTSGFALAQDDNGGTAAHFSFIRENYGTAFRRSRFLFEERIPPAMQVRSKKLYFCRKNKPPDERAETGSPTVYKFVQREVLLV